MLVDPVKSAAEQDPFGSSLEEVVAKLFEEPSDFVRVFVSDSDQLRQALIRLSGEEKCPLILTFGGTGPGVSDITPDATRGVLEKELPGFGEAMRHLSYVKAPTAILSRAIAGIRGQSLIINLPSRPNAAKGCLQIVHEALFEGIGQLTGLPPVRATGLPKEAPVDRWLPFLKRFKRRTPGER